MVIDNFILYALICAVFVSITAGAIGPFALLKRYSILADSLSHISLLGAVIGVIIGGGSIFISLIVSVVAVVIIEYLRIKKKLQIDAALVGLISGSLAGSVVLASIFQVGNSSIIGLLFGSLATVDIFDCIILSIVSISTIFFLYYYYDDYSIILFDEESAIVDGINVQKVNLIMALILASFVCVSIYVVGALMISALIVLSAMSAMRFNFELYKLMIISSIIALISSLGGVIISYYYPLPVGSVIVLLSMFIFIMVIFLKHK
jgi:zinc transport system permease protein